MPSSSARQDILDEARDLFVSDGAVAVTMRGVAARVGVTPMALYRHFESREALLAALVEQGHATFLTYLNRSLAQPTPRERLIAASRHYLAFALEHPQDYAVMFMEPAAPVAGRAPRQAWQDVATFRFLVDRIRDATAAGAMQTDDVEAAAITIWAQVHGLVSLYLAGKLPMDRRAFAAAFARTVEDVGRAFGMRAAAPGLRRTRSRRRSS